ncbi:MAG TPA: FixH family protein [Bacillus bacterium]|nr:FixH family protein [Bacillus sp. (in: firmicutes)]
MIRYLAVFFVMMLAITGCSNVNENNVNKEKTKAGTEDIKPISVDVAIYPSPIEVSHEVTFEATVTQGDEKVDDASDVEFELWKNGEEIHEKIKAEHQGDGIYSIKHSFAETGTYNVITHVTARDMHTMPQREFNVVDLQGQKNVQPKQETAVADHHHHGTDLLIHFMGDEEIKVNEEAQLKVHITYKKSPLKGARVRFEVWKDGQDKHQFIDATEDKAGEYSAKEIFNEQGTYNIKVHVEEEKNKIHDHQVENLTVH